MNTIESVKSSARKGCTPETRVVTEDMFPYGKYVRQGDVMLKRHPLGTVFATSGDTGRQLAPGTEVGSKHIVRPGPLVLARVGATPLQGAIIEAAEGLYVEHPKHAHFDIRCPGTYEVIFQQDLNSEEIRRVKD